LNAQYADEPLPNRAGESWRAWLMTGAPRGQVDRRRVRGAHLGIKRMLADGMRSHGDERPYTWKEFSDSLVRQSVGEAMTLLGPQDARLVKLAYFGGMSNRDIARHTGLRESMVQRRLRQAIDAISRHVERGRHFGQRMIAAVAVWLSGRWADDAVHGAVQAAAVAAAAVIVATHPAAASPATDAHGVVTPAAPAAAAPVVPPMPSPTAPVAAPSAAPEASTVTSALPAAPAVQLPAVQVPTVSLPAVPPAPSVSQLTSTVKKGL
jgi:DNA-directed RNA polymerase specialized sigma24 family protein